MAAHSEELIEAAKALLATRLQKWDAELAFENLVERDLCVQEDDLVSSHCVMIESPEAVTDEMASALLDDIFELWRK